MPLIEEMFAFVTIDKQPKGCDEGLIGFNADGTWMPLVGADMARVQSLIPVAEMMKEKLGIEYRIVKFCVRKDITEEVLNEFNSKKG